LKVKALNDYELKKFLTILWAEGVFSREDPPEVAAEKIVNYLRNASHLPRIDDLSYEENIEFYKKAFQQLSRKVKAKTSNIE